VKRGAGAFAGAASIPAKTPITHAHRPGAPLSETLRASRGPARGSCIEKIADDAETLELGLIENIQRKDLTPLKEAAVCSAWPSHITITLTTKSPERLAAPAHRSPKCCLCVIIPPAIRKSGRVEHRNRLEITFLAADRSPAQRKEDAGNGRPHHPGRSHPDEARQARKEESPAAIA